MKTVVLVAVLAGCSSKAAAPPAPPEFPHRQPSELAKLAQGAQLFPDLGTHTRPIATTNLTSQRYFDQGLRLLYGFNHDEAARSFAQAALLDPTCAMCFWGVSYALGPNYNVPMLPDRFALAWATLQQAKAASGHALPAERALIGALASRYSGPKPHGREQQHPLDVSYAKTMREVARLYPADDDIQVLAAEALMDVNPWQLWTQGGTAAAGTDEIIARLEAVLARNPNHPGANHYYIHAVEASPQPQRGLPAANRLAKLMPAAGHTVHMPAHIYQRVGLYAEASAANRAAIAADRAYLARTKPPGHYPMYVGHNYGFLAYSSAMEGRSLESLAAARESARAIPPEMLDMMPGMDFFPALPLLAMVRFSKWDDLLEEPRPDPKYHALTGLWLHAHGMALAAKGRIDDARADLNELRMLMVRVPPEERASNNTTREILAVGEKALEARIADAKHDPRAQSLWEKAVALEDDLNYAEPADWFYPLRHFQGESLLAAGRAEEAEAVYRMDLVQHPRNGWALTGLAEALRAQSRVADAEYVEQARDVAWNRADIRPVRTAF